VEFRFGKREKDDAAEGRMKIPSFYKLSNKFVIYASVEWSEKKGESVGASENFSSFAFLARRKNERNENMS
jgi:hypothetical protein